MIFHNSQKIFYRNPFGAQPIDTHITLRVKASKRVFAVTLRLWNSEEGEIRRDMIKSEKGGFFEASFFTSHTPGWIWYYFIVTEDAGNGTTKDYYYGNTPSLLGGIGAPSDTEPPAYQITVYDRDADTPQWVKEGVMYHIFVDRFKRGTHSPTLGQGLKKGQVAHAHWDDEPLYGRDDNGNVLQYDFFGGDLAGIMESLPYLRSLGVTVLYLSPIMDSVSNHKYDVGDYKTVDAAFGSNRLFRLLTAKAHAHGLRVILDGVFSHTGAESIYFNRGGTYPGVGASQSTESPYYSWYHFDEYPQKYRCWWGMTNMPEVTEETASYQQFLLWDEDSVVHQWHHNGIDGWRLDVADELPDSFLIPFRKAVKESNPQAFIVGEVWEDASRKESYGNLRPYFQGYELDSVMNYPFRTSVIQVLTGRISVQEGMATLRSLHENYPLHVFYSTMNLLSSHDERRILTELGEAPDMSGWTQEQRQDFRVPPEQRERALRRLKLATLWQFTFPGIPDIYYGDEAEVEGDKDPYNRRTYPWGNENKELQDWFRFLGSLRQNHGVLRTGTWEPMADEQLVAYRRSIEGGRDVFDEEATTEEAYIWINPGTESVSRDTLLPDGYAWQRWTESECNGEIFEDAVGEISIAPEGFCLLLGIPKQKEELYIPTLLRQPWTRNTLKEHGILLHPTCLPSVDGIGDLGAAAYQWVDLLAKTGHQYWQVLPLTAPALANSPYTAYSGTAGDTRLISMDALVEDGLLTQIELDTARLQSPGEGQIQPDKVELYKSRLLEIAWKNFQSMEDGPLKDEFEAFTAQQAHWLEPYSIFEAKKMEDRTKPWNTWGVLATYDAESVALAQIILRESILVVKFRQWLFYRQWQKLHAYAQEKDVCIIGDLPFFVAYDSADVWANRHLFDLDEAGTANTVAGVPPDYFCVEGQHWGNPQYDWAAMKRDGFSWWIQNVKQLLTLTDIVRLDHFRGYESFWAIPGTATTAIEGHWEKGPGIELFDAVFAQEGPLPFIAEDLGLITSDVEQLRQSVGLPGMKVLQFAFSEDPISLQGLADRVVYTGTHDNDILLGWLQSLRMEGDTFTLQQITDYLGLANDATDSSIREALLQELYTLPCRMTIVPLQDFMDPAVAQRMNTPGVVNNTNWLWRLPAEYMTEDLEYKLRKLVKIGENMECKTQ